MLGVGLGSHASIMLGAGRMVLAKAGWLADRAIAIITAKGKVRAGKAPLSGLNIRCLASVTRPGASRKLSGLTPRIECQPAPQGQSKVIHNLFTKKEGSVGVL